MKDRDWKAGEWYIINSDLFGWVKAIASKYKDYFYIPNNGMESHIFGATEYKILKQ